MSKHAFATPEEAESAFYRAFERTDIEAMMKVWSTEEPVSCIHPMGKILRGHEEIRRGWELLFRGDHRMHFSIERHQHSADSSLVIHTVTENIYLHGDSHPRPPIIATNIYKHTDAGWRMILHHASPSVLDTKTDKPEPPPEPQLH